MSVVSTIRERELSRSSGASRLSPDAPGSGAAPWVYLVLLWAIATALLAVGASAVISLGS